MPLTLKSLAAALAIAIAPAQQSTAPSHPTAPAPIAQRGTPATPLLVKVLPLDSAPGTAERQEAIERRHLTNESRIASGTIALAGVTGLLAIGTVALAIFTFGLWKDSRESVKAAGASAEAAEAALLESRRMVALMERNAHRELRAYLTVEPGSAVALDTEDGSGTHFYTAPILINTGKTPAYNIHRIDIADVLPCPPVGPFPVPGFAFKLGVPRFVGGVLSPGQQRALETRSPLIPLADRPYIERMAGKALLAWGRVTYEDAWGRPHWITYSVSYGWSDDGGLRPVFPERHNDTDRDPIDDPNPTHQPASPSSTPEKTADESR